VIHAEPRRRGPTLPVVPADIWSSTRRQRGSPHPRADCPICCSHAAHMTPSRRTPPSTVHTLLGWRRRSPDVMCSVRCAGPGCRTADMGGRAQGKPGCQAERGSPVPRSPSAFRLTMFCAHRRCTTEGLPAGRSDPSCPPGKEHHKRDDAYQARSERADRDEEHPHRFGELAQDRADHDAGDDDGPADTSHDEQSLA
jgi:hypothetical protein